MGLTVKRFACSLFADERRNEKEPSLKPQTPKKNMTTKNRIQVTIKKSTAKAHLIVADDRECWVQKRWLRQDDMTVSAKTFDRQATAKVEREALVKEIRDNTRAFRDGRHAVKIERETEKAIACKAYFEDGYCTIDGERLAWFPKSQVRDGAVPGWLIIAKAQELGERLIGGQNHFSITVVEIGGVEINENVRPARW